MPEWDADIALSLDDARELIAAVHPVAGRSGRGRPSELGPVERVAEGWDNTVYALAGGWLYRFPRRRVAVEGVRVECAVLPRLAARLPVAIPAPVAVGRPSARFPWPYFGYRRVPGRELARADFDPARQADLAEPLARFLRALHAPDLAEALGPELPVDPMGRGDIDRRVDILRATIARLTGRGFQVDRAAVDAVIEAAAGVGQLAPRAVVHGDLHMRHVLVDDDRRLSGIIDWGDVHLGHPAVDLNVAWCVLPPEGRRRFRAAYGPIDDRAWLGARVLGVFLAAALALSSADFDLPDVERAALVSLENALRD